MSGSIGDGVWPVMITPYTPDNKIDYPAVDKMLEWYQAQNVTGVFAVCQSSEMHVLSRDERAELAKFVVDHAPAGMGVIASGHVEDSLELQVEDAKRTIDAGVDSFVFISNRFAAEGEGDDVAKKAIEVLVERIPAESFGIYECPRPYKRLMSPELLRWCAESGKFSFLKDTCCHLGQLKAKIDAVRGTNLKVFNANAATLLASLEMGAAGYSGVMANFHPALYAWLCANYATWPQLASAVQDFLGFASLAECQEYPVNAKYHMRLEGVEMELSSRVRDAAGFTHSKRLEVEQMRRTVRLFEGRFMQDIVA